MFTLIPLGVTVTKLPWKLKCDYRGSYYRQLSFTLDIGWGEKNCSRPKAVEKLSGKNVKERTLGGLVT